MGYHTCKQGGRRRQPCGPGNSKHDKRTSGRCPEAWHPTVPPARKPASVAPPFVVPACVCDTVFCRHADPLGCQAVHQHWLPPLQACRALPFMPAAATQSASAPWLIYLQRCGCPAPLPNGVQVPRSGAQLQGGSGGAPVVSGRGQAERKRFGSGGRGQERGTVWKQNRPEAGEICYHTRLLGSFGGGRRLGGAAGRVDSWAGGRACVEKKRAAERVMPGRLGRAAGLPCSNPAPSEGQLPGADRSLGCCCRLSGGRHLTCPWCTPRTRPG